MIKKLFNASFEQSQRIQGKYEAYIKNLHRQMGYFNVLFIGLLAIFFAGGMFYVLGINVPVEFARSEKNTFVNISGENMILAGKIGQPLVIVSEITLIIWISTFIVLLILRLLPIWNVRTFSFFGGIGLFQMSLLLFFSFLPMLVGLAVVGSGVIGFSFQVITILLYFALSMRQMVESLSKDLYDDKFENNLNWKVVSVVAFTFILLFINSYAPKIGFITKESDEYSMIYGWLFLFFGVGTIALIRYAVFKNFLCAYYFAKYSSQYRELWELTDEQWYGKGKARRMARKERRKNKKGEM